MSSLPKLSVVVPAYNEEQAIVPCLLALAGQLEQIEEIIVVNNNSTDGTADVVKEFQAHYPKITLLFEPKRGLLPARDCGVAAAKTELVARIDADTIVSPTWATEVRDYFADPTHADIQAASGPVYPHDAPALKIIEPTLRFFFVLGNKLSGGIGHLFGSNMVLRRSVWPQVHPHLCSKGEFLEDLDISIHLTRLRQDIGYMSHAKAGISSRRLRTTPRQYALYLTLWPRTYRDHHMKSSAAVIWIFVLISEILQTLVWPLLRAYHPERRKFSARWLFSKQEGRDIPELSSKEV